MPDTLCDEYYDEDEDYDKESFDAGYAKAYSEISDRSVQTPPVSG